jgi:hypothetical protein
MYYIEFLAFTWILFLLSWTRCAMRVLIRLKALSPARSVMFVQGMNWRGADAGSGTRVPTSLPPYTYINKTYIKYIFP